MYNCFGHNFVCKFTEKIYFIDKIGIKCYGGHLKIIGESNPHMLGLRFVYLMYSTVT